jgi:hypothetical protein
MEFLTAFCLFQRTFPQCQRLAAVDQSFQCHVWVCYRLAWVISSLKFSIQVCVDDLRVSVRDRHLRANQMALYLITQERGCESFRI